MSSPGTRPLDRSLQLGYVHPLGGQRLLEGAYGAWFFSQNDDFLGSTRGQDPITGGVVTESGGDYAIASLSYAVAIE